MININAFQMRSRFGQKFTERNWGQCPYASTLFSHGTYKISLYAFFWPYYICFYPLHIYVCYIPIPLQGAPGTCTPLSVQILWFFMQVFRKIFMQNNTLAHPSVVGTPLWEILNPPKFCRHSPVWDLLLYPNAFFLMLFRVPYKFGANQLGIDSRRLRVIFYHL